MNYWTVCPTSRFEIVIKGNFIFSEREVLTAYIIKKYNIGCKVTSIGFSISFTLQNGILWKSQLSYCSDKEAALVCFSWCSV